MIFSFLSLLLHVMILFRRGMKKTTTYSLFLINMRKMMTGPNSALTHVSTSVCSYSQLTLKARFPHVCLRPHPQTLPWSTDRARLIRLSIIQFLSFSVFSLRNFKVIPAIFFISIYSPIKLFVRTLFF